MTKPIDVLKDLHAKEGKNLKDIYYLTLSKDEIQAEIVSSRNVVNELNGWSGITVEDWVEERLRKGSME